MTVASFAQRHAKCASQLPARLLHTGITAAEKQLWKTPGRFARVGAQLQGAQKDTFEIVEDVIVNMRHIKLFFDANFTGKYLVNVEEPARHPLIASA